MAKKSVDINKYFNENAILIVDKNTSSRTRLLKTIIDIGGKKQNILTCGHIDEAQQFLSNKKLNMVISDYKIGGGFGFDLFQLIRNNFPDRKDLSLILITSNLSQNNIAKAAEEEVDNILLKPYTILKIQSAIVDTITQKIAPSKYMMKIEEGKKLLIEKKYEESVKSFRDALKLDPKPALAMFYLGQIEMLYNNTSDATANYNKGLTYNDIHFKCLIGLFDIMVEHKEYERAYAIVKKLAKFFPTNPERLSQGVHLAVRTKNIDDMLEFYECFKELEDRSPNAINYIGAGLYIAGKYYFMNGKVDEGLKVFEAVAISCADHTKFLRAMIEVLVNFDKVDVAESYLKRFNEDAYNSPDYLISDFLLTAKTESNPNNIMKKASVLSEKKIKSNACFELLSDVLIKADISKTKIENFDLKEVS